MKTRTGEAFMPADEYGRGMRPFSVNLLVREMQVSLTFYERVLGAMVRYADDDFAVLKLLDFEFMLHADHTYDHHPLFERLKTPGLRGTGAELRVFGIDPDLLEQRAGGRGYDYSDHAGFSARVAGRDAGGSGRIYLGGGSANAEGDVRSVVAAGGE